MCWINSSPIASIWRSRLAGIFPHNSRLAREQIASYASLLEGKDLALRDSATSYQELRRRFDEQLDDLQRSAEQMASQEPIAQLQSCRTQIENLERLLAQKDVALRDAGNAYQELRRRFDEQLDELQRNAEQMASQTQALRHPGYEAQIENLEYLLEQKEVALRDAADSYLELRRRFDEQLDELKRMAEQKTGLPQSAPDKV